MHIKIAYSHDIGWKNVNGVKTYATYRGGKVVSDTGKAAFVLAMGDSSKKNEKKKSKDQNPHIMDSDRYAYMLVSIHDHTTV